MVYFLGIWLLLWLLWITREVDKIQDKLTEIRNAISDLQVPKLSAMREKAERELKAAEDGLIESEARAARVRTFLDTP